MRLVWNSLTIFNLVSKRPLCLCLLEFPMNGIVLWFERCLKALGFVKAPQSMTCGRKDTHLSHPMSTGTLWLHGFHLHDFEKRQRREEGQRGSLKKIICLLLCFSHWQVFIFSHVYPGNKVLPPGASLGSGLTPEAAKDLGLPAGIAVAASLIDAHAGGLGNLLLHAPTNAVFNRILLRTGRHYSVVKAKIESWWFKI